MVGWLAARQVARSGGLVGVRRCGGGGREEVGVRWCGGVREEVGVRRCSSAGVYIHWPYCTKKCSYCNFNKYVVSDVDHER